MAVLAPFFFLGTRSAWALPPGDACSLLTQTEVSAGLGVSVGAGYAPFPKGCQWKEQAKPGTAILLADLNGPDLKMFNNVKSMTALTRATLTQVSGLGDEAYFYYRKAGKEVSEILWFRKGDNAFNVRVWGKTIPDADREAKEKAIALSVLGKL